jgi:hypothetical protein
LQRRVKAGLEIGEVKKKKVRNNLVKYLLLMANVLSRASQIFRFATGYVIVSIWPLRRQEIGLVAVGFHHCEKQKRYQL